MIVGNTGYIKLDDVLEMVKKGIPFSIYRTHKGTDVLVKDANQNQIYLYNPKKDKLPWKTIEGKKIANCVQLFDSSVNNIQNLDTSNWNGEQIMTYEPYII